MFLHGREENLSSLLLKWNEALFMLIPEIFRRQNLDKGFNAH